jgi:hypothetical protein
MPAPFSRVVNEPPAQPAARVASSPMATIDCENLVRIGVLEFMDLASLDH